jgi:tripartite-type tricarboxylate transporter receptor subunit TctC
LLYSQNVDIKTFTRTFNTAMNKVRRALTLGLASSGLAPNALFAQPAASSIKTVKILIPFSAGALTDIIARLYADKLSVLTGQTFMVENHPGAGGVTATRMLAASPADGSTWLFVSSGHATNPALRLKLPYDTVKDFSGLALVASSPSVVTVRADHPAKTLASFIDMAKRTPGKLSYGSAGVGSATHLAGEYFASEEGVKLLHVPYKGVQEAVNAVAGGQLDAAFPPVALVQSLIKAGRLRALAVTSQERVAVMPDTPTVAELGLPSFDYSIWYALVLPAATPKPLMQAFARNVHEVSSQPEVLETLRAQGLVPKDLMLGDFDKFIAVEIRKTEVLVKASGYVPE